MNKLRTLLPGHNAKDTARQAVTLEPEIGFQITIETHEQAEGEQGFKSGNGSTPVPELNVHLIAARHLPSLFGFKIVQGYLIKVKLFPGTKRLDSSIQTNTWPKFNENFKFPLVPDIKPSLKHGSAFATRRQPQSSSSGDSCALDELFAGQFVVFTVYALLELPAASFNRFNKTYRSLKDKSTNFVQRLATSETPTENGPTQKEKVKNKKSENPRDSMPPLTISESRRNIGSVTCYLETKNFKRNARNGTYSTEELWLPIKDITTTVLTKTPNNNNYNNNGSNNSNNLTNSPKGVVELALEVRDLGESESLQEAEPHLETTSANNWQRVRAEMKRKMGMSNVTNVLGGTLMLRVTTARMRCSNKVKDELEATAGGGVYVKTTVFEHNIYVDAWKSPLFYPSLSTKWDGAGGDEATICIPLRSVDQLENMVIRITLATKLKMGKKLVLGTVIVGGAGSESGLEQLRLLRESPLNERVATWHCYH